ncbi:MAG: RNA 3'-terminal phosphate cyclase [Methanomassiliicoccales archaeon]|nr:RNA 3'-terminal phosphate cyclase [Methanomassiliicoccales archaeon]
MIEVDGSLGEGGGQILRTSVSLSAVTRKPVKIVNIRAKRKNPGLAPSHLTSIDSVARISDADVDGLYPGSQEITFSPRELLGGEFEFDVGTAGSISLVLQTCLIPAALSKSRVVINVKGGTDVNWSPPIDFMRMVHLPILERFGPSCDLEMTARGFYPEGGGEVRLEVSPVSKLQAVKIEERGQVRSVEGVAYAQNLPEDVALRIKHAAIKKLADFKAVTIELDFRRGHSTGAGIVLVARCDNTLLGASVLGAKGVRSETLGENCALDLAETVHSGATVDEHMLDQVLPYMALAEGNSVVLADEMTAHAGTNISVIEKFLGKRFSVEEAGELVRIETL